MLADMRIEPVAAVSLGPSSPVLACLERCRYAFLLSGLRQSFNYVAHSQASVVSVNTFTSYPHDATQNTIGHDV